MSLQGLLVQNEYHVFFHSFSLSDPTPRGTILVCEGLSTEFRGGSKFAQLPVGPDGSVLTANSSAPLGVEWVMPNTYLQSTPQTTPQATKSPKCVICQENNVGAACIPCGHYNFCFECIVAYWKTKPEQGCPMCRDKIAFVNKIFTV